MVDELRGGDAETRAAELAVHILASRVGTATARPSVAEGRETAAYFRILLRETRRALGLPDIPEPEPEPEPEQTQQEQQPKEPAPG